ncbi:hypothetical protein WDU94_009999 [Cyamophila willieti]
MVSPGYLFKTLETFGLLNLHRYKSQRRARYQTLFTFVTTHLLLFYVICQCFNVFTRAIRYFPEFVQELLDNTLMGVLLFMMYRFQSIHREMEALCDCVDKSFSTADVQVIRQCHLQTNVIVVGILIVVFLGFSGDVLELVVPLSDSERNIRLNIYGESYLKRHLPYIIRVPWINENNSPAYEILFGLEMHIFVLGTVLASLSISFIPIITIHIQSQYKILCKYIRMIGQEHKDELGYRIFYTEIERNQYTIKLYSPDTRGTNLTRITTELEEARKQKMYEQNYLRQIAKFHQKLLAFQDQVCFFV